jgi:hypothetical protein
MLRIRRCNRGDQGLNKFFVGSLTSEHLFDYDVMYRFEVGGTASSQKCSSAFGGGEVSVLSMVVSLRQALASFEPELCSSSDCARLAGELTATAKACTAASVMAAARAVEAGAHKEMGVADGPRWLARQSGSTPGQARQALDMVKSLEDLPDTKAAFLAGDISIAQTSER